jgi:hypothetical protein
MKKAILLIVFALVMSSLVGCSACRQMTCGWFNRGDRCNPGPPPDCAPGGPRAMMMVPSTTQVLPGPIEVAPVN